MKIKSLVVFVPLVFIQAIIYKNETPCQKDLPLQSCIENIGDFIFLKQYSIDGINTQYVENSYPLTKGTSYLINLCSKESNDMVVSIFDKQRNLISTNLSKDKLAKSMRFDCSATGIYYLRYQSKSHGKFCGESILAFRRSKTELNTSSSPTPGTSEK